MPSRPHGNTEHADRGGSRRATFVAERHRARPFKCRLEGRRNGRRVGGGSAGNGRSPEEQARRGLEATDNARVVECEQYWFWRWRCCCSKREREHTDEPVPEARGREYRGRSKVRANYFLPVLVGRHCLRVTSILTGWCLQNTSCVFNPQTLGQE